MIDTVEKFLMSRGFESTPHVEVDDAAVASVGDIRAFASLSPSLDFSIMKPPKSCPIVTE